MNLKALSHYDSDNSTRYGDSILLFDSSSLVVYDCGHLKHAAAIQHFLNTHKEITNVYIVVSHNDNDHTLGVCDLIEWLGCQEKYAVTLYTHQYLKYTEVIREKVGDGRRTHESIKAALLDEFDNIKKIIECAQQNGYSCKEALPEITFADCTIVGPTVDEFTAVAAQAIDNRVNNLIGEGHAEETVMNAASTQVKCKLSNAEVVLLCGDASPQYFHDVDKYDIIQFPHHGQLADAQALIEILRDDYAKQYLISDNTGTGTSSGGSDKLMKYLANEKYNLNRIYNTKQGIIDLPASSNTHSGNGGQGVRLGAMVSDYGEWNFWEQT